MRAKDIIRHVLRKGGREVRQTGSHVICELPNGDPLIVPVHGHKDLGKGLACKILKALALAGIPYAIWVALPYISKAIGLV